MVSIIIPAYNAQNYIRDAILSVFNQTYTHWELIVIDDCSTDQTSQIIQEFLNQSDKLKYVKNITNQGVAISRNIGVSLAVGEWVAFLDSDDCWSAEKLALQLQCAHHTNGLFIFSGSSFINETGLPLDYYLSVPESITFPQLLKQNLISCSSVLIKRTLISQYPMEHDSDMHEDFAVWLQILRDNHIHAYAVNKPLLLYRIHATSKSSNKIKAGLMTFRVYRYIGLEFFPAFYNWLFYFFRSICKYKNIW